MRHKASTQIWSSSFTNNPSKSLVVNPGSSALKLPGSPDGSNSSNSAFEKQDAV